MAARKKAGKKPGTVYLVGAGPGDPGLLTVRGRELLERAQVLVYDYLANPLLLSCVPAACERIFVGKKGGGKSNVPQEKINSLIVAKARSGKRVVRLKGGDPFVFGRGGEEAQELRKARIPFEIVPGVTSGIAAPAYAGIPVTHRDHCSQVTLLTGHDAQGRALTQVEWEKLARGTGTLVIYMGVGNLESNARALIQGGRPARTPAALIEWGTYPRQRTIVSDLREIARDAQKARIGAPAIFVVGTVVKLRQELQWLESKPLFGKRILVTRARTQASGLLQKLLDLGAEPVPFPTIEIAPPPSWKPLDAALSRLSGYDWAIWTSVNGVESFFSRLQEKKRDIRELAGAKIAAIGPATAQALEARGLRVQGVPREFDAEGLLAYFGKQELQGGRILLPRALEAREILPQELRRMGARVDVVPVYRSVLPKAGGKELRGRIEAGGLDLITFASSSTVSNFLELVEKDLAKTVAARCAIACIGPITAQTAKSAGLPVHIQPKSYTIEALVEAIVSHFARRQRIP